ncbi:retinol dehydrogenase 10-like [Ascaphus truei]|uniref:retinol dehydrogenase 10-like n=1 Tax=Ascaphus truei TaxID=8439 RepID=UPI003F5931FB
MRVTRAPAHCCPAGTLPGWLGVTGSYVFKPLPPKRTVKAFLPGMIAMDHGHIITVASHLGLIATPYMEDYCASHFAAVGFHESLSHTLKAQRIDGVKTTLICPYSVNTGMFTESPVKRDLGIFPSSRTDCYVRRAMKGILIDQPVMCVPRAMYLAAFLKHVLPWEAQLLYFKFLGANKSMYGCAQTEEAHQR